MKCMLTSHCNINELLTNSCRLNGNILYCYIQKSDTLLNYTSKFSPFDINDLIYFFSDLKNYKGSYHKGTNIDSRATNLINAGVNVITFESIEEMSLYIRKVNSISFLG